MIYYALYADGNLLEIGDHGSFDDADEAAGEDAVWILSEESADQWRRTLAIHRPAISELGDIG